MALYVAFRNVQTLQRTITQYYKYGTDNRTRDIQQSIEIAFVLVFSTVVAVVSVVLSADMGWMCIVQVKMTRSSVVEQLFSTSVQLIFGIILSNLINTLSN